MTTTVEIVARVGKWAACASARKRFHDQCQRFDSEVFKRGDRIVHPLDWLRLPRTGPGGWLVDQLYGQDDLPRLSESDALCADYVLLAIVHAGAMRGNPRARPLFDGIWDDDVDWIRSVRERLADGEGNGTIECWLHSALNNVEADLLPEKPNGSGQAGGTTKKAGTPRRKAASNDRPKQRGRPRKHTDAKCKKALTQFGDLYANSNDATGAWNTVSDNLDFESGEAARKACERYQQSQHSGQNGQK